MLSAAGVRLNMKWNQNLPDTATWQPRPNTKAKDTIQQSLVAACEAAQQRIIQEGIIERGFNIENYDSGPGLEDITRQELRKLLPSRYEISPGVVNDAGGATSGECDILVSNGIWAPQIKPKVTSESRRIHFPIESVYAVLEVKQTLTFKSLDQGMEKLVGTSRLTRPKTMYGQITENMNVAEWNRPGWILNPLFTVLLASGVGKRSKFDELADRFFLLNQNLNRDEKVNVLCALGHGVAYYVVKEDSSLLTASDYMRDRDKQLLRIKYDGDLQSCFYVLYSLLLPHLNRSILSVSDLVSAYGIENIPIQIGKEVD